MNNHIVSLSTGNRGIDIHHHFLPPFFVDALIRSGQPDAEKAGELAWSPEKSLAMMDASAIETAIVSMSLPGVSFHGADDPPALARQANEYAARMISDHPGRFGAFAELPVLDERAAFGELEHALDVLGLDGVTLHSNIRGRYLGDERFDALLAELDRRRAIVFLHPNKAPGPGFNDFVEFPHEVTRAVASLTESGALERYTHIRYILAYGGGTIPFIASRVTVVGMDVFGNFLLTMKRFVKRVRTMKRMSYDITSATDDFALKALYGHAGSKRMLMGSNFPWSTTETFARQRKEIGALEELNQKQLGSIERNNSLRLFPRFAGR